MRDGLTWAIPKGRIYEQAWPLLRAIGLSAPEPGAEGRKLVLELAGGHRCLLVKPSDVPIYVERGVADVGLAGRDTLEEAARDLYEPLDLGIGRCRMVVAGPAGPAAEPRRPRAPGIVTVGTKYPRIAHRHYRALGLQADVIALSGSVELASVTGLVDEIVDLVESGETLRQNQLEIRRTLFEVSTRFVVHPASFKLRMAAIEPLLAELERAVRRAQERAA